MTTTMTHHAFKMAFALVGDLPLANGAAEPALSSSEKSIDRYNMFVLSAAIENTLAFVGQARQGSLCCLNMSANFLC